MNDSPAPFPAPPGSRTKTLPVSASPGFAGASGNDGDPASAVWSRRVAHVLDTCLKIPGTTARIGLDPIIGLIPGVGDAIATFMGGFILAEALRRRIPGRLIIRIGGNMLLNAAVGAIPVAGDIFSAWFHSNSRNHEILQTFLDGKPDLPSSPQSRWVIAGFILFLLLLTGFCILAFYLLAVLWRTWTAS